MITVLSGFAAGSLHVLSGPDHLAALDPMAAADHGKAIAFLTPAFERVMADDAPVIAPDVVAGVVDSLATSQAAMGRTAQAAATLEAFIAHYGSDPLQTLAVKGAQLKLAELR